MDMIVKKRKRKLIFYKYSLMHAINYNIKKKRKLAGFETCTIFV